MFKWLRGDAAREHRPRRVAVIDAIAVDRNRSVVLVRRDNIEHLLIVGGRTDMVVEANIVRATAARESARPAAHGPARLADELPNRTTSPEGPEPSLESDASRVDAPIVPLVQQPASQHVVESLAELTRQLEVALNRSSAAEDRSQTTHSPTAAPQKNELKIKHREPEPMTEPKSTELSGH